MKSRGFFPEPYWFWIGTGALVGYVIVLNSLFVLALAYFDRKCPSLLEGKNLP